MQIERIYQPDVQYQLQALLILLRLQLPHERSTGNNQKDDGAINQHSTGTTDRRTEDEQELIEEALS